MMLTREEEQRLIRCVLQGDSGAFEPLVRAYQQKIYNLSLRMTKNPADAEDLTQEAFLKAFRSLERFRQDSGFYVWVYRIASNLCIDFLRREKQRGGEHRGPDLHRRGGGLEPGAAGPARPAGAGAGAEGAAPGPAGGL